MKISTKMDNTLLCFQMDMIGYAWNICDGIDKTNFVVFFNLRFNGHDFGGMKQSLFLLDKGCIWPRVDMIFNNGQIKCENFNIRLGKNVTKLLEERFICDHLL
jgi:hypothetical protein